MSIAPSDPGSNGHGRETDYERSDTSFRFLLLAGLGAAVLFGLALFVSWRAVVVFSGTPDVRLEPTHEAGPGAGIEIKEAMRAEIFRQQRKDQEKVLNSYGWISRESGIARIPIERAMELLVERARGPKGQRADAER
jgi:hypothetical protein